MPSTIICYDVLGSDSLEVTLYADGSDTPIDGGDFTRRTNDTIAGTFTATGLSGLHRIVLKTAAGAERWAGWVVLASSGTLEAQDSPHAARMATMVAPDGAVWKFSANALEEAPAGGGSGDCPTVEEIAAAVEDVLTSIDVTVSATSLIDGEPLRITKGDDYETSAAPSTAIVMTLTGTGLHSTTGDTWKLWLNTPGADPVETTAAATSSATNSLTLTFELTKTQTDTLTTIAGGTWTVRQVTATTAYKSAKKSGRLIVSPNPETERAA
jgi:hypothetical protein